ncbi:26S proteasome regulatory subunit Rpn6p [Trichomonascus vanleenenianus]|uniref:proteasome regulatory particle lid subunit RPN6 n=1 Tax=Trichomonascus vanleenenianus TaxID=2268995 RepID=UPI003ECA6164
MNKVESETLTQAREAAKEGRLAESEQVYRSILTKENRGTNEKVIAEQEAALNELARLYKDHGKVNELAALIRESREVMGGFAKSKTAKIIRSTIDLLAELPGTLEVQVAVTRECIEWAVAENRNFLRQGLETRLIGLLYEKKAYNDAIGLINTLLKELRKLDDKMMLVEVQLLEAKVYHALRNIPKSRASLTSARTSANAVYCPPLVQAALDKMSGMLQAEDKDYKTAYSYFYEAFEGYASQEDPEALRVLKYLLLSKIMLNRSDDLQSLLTSKSVLKYAGRDIDAMKAIAEAHKNRSLKEFESVLETYGNELSSDPFIRSHFSALYDTLLEQNLVKVIEPFSCVEIAHIAELIGLDTRQIEGKLSQMILDKVFYGVLDQGSGWLFVYDEPKSDKTYDLALETIGHMSNVVDLLYEKAAALN